MNTRKDLESPLYSKLAAILGKPEMKRFSAVLVLLSLLFAPMVASSQTVSTVPNLLAPPGTGERYGQAVAIDGDIMAVSTLYGASVDIRGRDVGGPNNWGVIKSVSSPTGDYFGYALALDGDTLVLGSYAEGPSIINTFGAVYVFQRDQGGSNNWGLVKRFNAPVMENGQDFGYSVDLDGDTLVVGAPGHPDSDGYLRAGTAFVFERNNGGPNQWGFTQQLGLYSSEDDKFGYDVAVSGDIIVASEPFNAYGHGGSVNIYQRNQGGPGNWGHLVTRRPTSSVDRFGWRIDLDGDRLVVGSPKGGWPRNGLAVIFERNVGGTDNWGELATLTAVDGADGDYFGRDVFTHNDRVYVGATYDDDNAQDSGSVYVFEQNLGGTNNWGLVEKLQAFDAATEDWFGYSIAVDGTSVVIGAQNRNGGDGAVYVTGPAPNPAPVAEAQQVTTDEDVSVGITLAATDSQPLTFQVVTQPSHGTLSGAAPNLTYTPDADFNGSDTFEFVADDNTSVSAVATVDITVESVNDAPVVQDISRTTVEDVPISITLAGSDVESDALTFEVLEQPSSGALSGTAPDLTYTPDPSFVGSDGFAFRANDGELDSQIATVTVRINAENPNNRAPVAQPQVMQAQAGVAKTFTLSGSDPDGDTIGFEVIASPSHGTLTGTAPSLTYTSEDGFEGTDTLTFVVSDGALDSSPADVLINVSADPDVTNAPPVFQEPAADANLEVEVGSDFEFVVLATDADDDPITYDANGLPPGASLDAQTGRLTWTPEKVGTHELVLTASDGVSSATRSVTMRAFEPDRNSNASASADGCGCSATNGSGAPASLVLFVLLFGVIRLRSGASGDVVQVREAAK